jgi:hypothetical protein
MLEERDEEHLMFGHGGVYHYSMKNVYTQSFAAPHADRNSKALAWATLDNAFSFGYPGRAPVFWHRGYLCGVRFWFVTAVFGAVGLLCMWTRSRIVPDGLCRMCRYDLRGSPTDASGVVTCPECGRASTPLADEDYARSALVRRSHVGVPRP